MSHHLPQTPPASDEIPQSSGQKVLPADTITSDRTGLLREEAGFTLTELMVVLVIIGILALLALPRFMKVTTKAKMTEAQMNLKQVLTLEQAFQYEHDVYSTDLPAIGFEQNPLVTDGGNARYRISVERADQDGFIAVATSVVDFDKDGTFNVWQVDQNGQITQRTED